MGLVLIDFIGFAIAVFGITSVIRGIIELNAFFSDQADYYKHEIPSFGFQKLRAFAQIIVGAVYVFAGLLGSKIYDLFKVSTVFAGVALVIQFIFMIGIGTNDDYKDHHKYNSFEGSLNFAVPTYQLGVNFMIGVASIILFKLYKGGNSSNPLVPAV